MSDIIWWIVLIGALVGAVITSLLRDPFVERVEKLIAELEKEYPDDDRND
ncbi:hypothetical protein [Mesorhizobium sp. SP-1A]|nr:hypothetical protein [Mesorhizobium sp. SP-1A]